MYQYKEKYTLDFSNVKTRIEMHEVIEKELDFPSYYGANWDAFWDCITDLLLSNKSMCLEILGLDKIYIDFKREVDILIDTLKELKHVYNDKFANDVKIVIHHGKSAVELS